MTSISPSNIVGAIANEADIESRFIGEIKLHDDYSTVDLPQGMPADAAEPFEKRCVFAPSPCESACLVVISLEVNVAVTAIQSNLRQRTWLAHVSGKRADSMMAVRKTLVAQC